MPSILNKLRTSVANNIKDIVLYTIAVTAAVHVFNSQGLFADGCHYLVRILEQKSWIFSDESRRFIVAIFQTPVVLAVLLGVKNIDALIWLHSLGLFAFPVAFWLIALGKLKKEPYFWPFLTVYAVVYLNTGWCGVGEYNPAYACAAAAMAMLLASKRLVRTDGLFLVATAIILLEAYEAMVFLGPLLFVAAMLRLAQDPERNRAEFFWVSAAAFFFAAATAIAAWSVLYPRDPHNIANAGSLSILYRDRQILISMIAGGLYMLFWGLQAHGVSTTSAEKPGVESSSSPQRGGRPSPAAGPAESSRFASTLLRLATALSLPNKLAKTSLFLAVLLIVPLAWASPMQHYLARSLGGAAMFGLFIVLVFVRFGGRAPQTDRPPTPRNTSPLTRRIPLVMFFVLTVPDLLLSFGYRGYLAKFQNEINAKTGFVRVEDAHFTPIENALYGWSWTYPSMSLVLRQDETKAIMLNPELKEGKHHFIPFDPLKSYPDLREYYKKR